MTAMGFEGLQLDEQLDEMLREIDCCTQLGLSPSVFASGCVDQKDARVFAEELRGDLVRCVLGHMRRCSDELTGAVLVADLALVLPAALRARVARAGGLPHVLGALRDSFVVRGRPGMECVALRSAVHAAGPRGLSRSASTSSTATVESPGAWWPHAAPASGSVLFLRGFPVYAGEEEVQEWVLRTLRACATGGEQTPPLGACPKLHLECTRDGRATGAAHLYLASGAELARAQRALHLAPFRGRFTVEARTGAAAAPPLVNMEPVAVGELMSFLAQQPVCVAVLQSVPLSGAVQEWMLRTGVGVRDVAARCPLLVLESPGFNLETVRLAHVAAMPAITGALDPVAVLTAATQALACADPSCFLPAPAAPLVTRLRLRGLPFTASEADVAAFIAREGRPEWLAGGLDAVRIQRRASGRPTGIALVYLVGVPRRDCLRMDGKYMGERYIEVFVADE